MYSDSIVGAATDGLSAQSKVLSAVVAAISGTATLRIGESTVVLVQTQLVTSLVL
jgi:hypothetical protein